MKKKNTYVLTLSKTFMSGHPDAGKSTNFKEKFLSGEKKHTIREGDHWKKVCIQVENETALLSVREWSKVPYRSKQEVIEDLHSIGHQRIKILKSGTILIDNKEINEATKILLANNDGLTWQQFSDWFDLGNVYFKGSIIHFTDLRY